MICGVFLASDVPVFRYDWDTVVEKVRHGRAHELSGSDTLYLEAATKGATGRDRTKQPYSATPAKPRSWAIKPSYMTVTLNGLLDMQSIRRNQAERETDLLALIQKRFEPYIGMTEDELAEACGYDVAGRRKPKSLCALITKQLLGIDVRYKIAEFEKAGIKTKTIRLQRNGVPRESVSFPTFSYFDVAEQPFEESDFYGYLRQKYLFVIYREETEERGVFRLAQVLFWQMPDRDLLEAKRCYEEMQRRINAGHAEQSVTSRENRCCHVRPHGRNKADTLPTPYGTQETKKCFWINARYIGEEIDRVERELTEATAQAVRERIDRSNVAGQVIRIAELFAGVGGFRLGLEGYDNPEHPEFALPAAGPFVTVWANQWEPQGSPRRQFAARCYEARFGKGSVVNDDIARVLTSMRLDASTFPTLIWWLEDFRAKITRGAPVVSRERHRSARRASYGGRSIDSAAQADVRGYVPGRTSIVCSKAPRRSGRDFAIILSCLSTLGYAVEWRVVNGADYGFPQKRRRVYIYAEQTNEAWTLRRPEQRRDGRGVPDGVCRSCQGV